MDKDTVVLLVKKAANEIPKRFPVWYANDSVPEKEIEKRVTEWWAYIDEHQQNLKSKMLSKDVIESDAKKYLDQYQKLLLDLQKGQTKMNFFQSSREYHEFRMLCGIYVCNAFVEWLERYPQGISLDVHIGDNPPPLILKLSHIIRNNCPNGLNDEEKANWVINEARKIGELDYQRWKKFVFGSEKKDRTDSEFLQWSMDQRNEVLNYEKNHQSEWSRKDIESPDLLNRLKVELRQDQPKNGNNSQLISPFDWATKLARIFKADLCMQLLKSVIEGIESSEEQIAKLREKKEVNLAEFKSFDQFFKSKTEFEETLKALKKLDKISDDNRWLGRKNELGVLAHVLKSKGYFQKDAPITDQILVPIIAQYFEISIGDRTTREKPNSESTFSADLKALLPKSPNLP